MISALVAASALASLSPGGQTGPVYDPSISFKLSTLPFKQGYLVYSSSDVVDMKITLRADNRRQDADLVFMRKGVSVFPCGSDLLSSMTWVSPSGKEYKTSPWVDFYSNPRNFRASILPDEQSSKVESYILSAPSYTKVFVTFSPLLAGHLFEMNTWSDGFPSELKSHPYHNSDQEKSILRFHDFKSFIQTDGTIRGPLPSAVVYNTELTIEITKRYPRLKTSDVTVGTGPYLNGYDWATVEMTMINAQGAPVQGTETQTLSPRDIASVTRNSDGSVESLCQALLGMKEGGVRHVAWPDGSFQQFKLVKVYPKDKWVDRFDG